MCPSSPKRRSFAPGTCSATQRPWAADTIASAPPCQTVSGMKNVSHVETPRCHQSHVVVAQPVDAECHAALYGSHQFLPHPGLHRALVDVWEQRAHGFGHGSNVSVLGRHAGDRGDACHSPAESGRAGQGVRTSSRPTKNYAVGHAEMVEQGSRIGRDTGHARPWAVEDSAYRGGSRQPPACRRRCTPRSGCWVDCRRWACRDGTPAFLRRRPLPSHSRSSARRPDEAGWAWTAQAWTKL